ncbi:MAG: 5-formyltetrahydrofolate cyclo-ligase [Acidisphaera sp.]|nr:5-formyltetrahydrofolate cyclo-ligase [Acidisphaera sp.]
MAAPHLLSGPHSVSELIERKRAARERALALRAECDPALGARLGMHVLAACPPAAGAVVAGFWPLPGEIDLRPLLQALHDHGHVVTLPVTPPRGRPLEFRRWVPGAALASGRFGTLHPEGETVQPDWLLVPLLAFDRAGRRLGYGAGYYDRTLAALPGAFALGCGYAAQELDEVPVAPYDVRLSAVATEHGVIVCKDP